jgi:hypothetical protein
MLDWARGSVCPAEGDKGGKDVRVVSGQDVGLGASYRQNPSQRATLPGPVFCTQEVLKPLGWTPGPPGTGQREREAWR